MHKRKDSNLIDPVERLGWDKGIDEILDHEFLQGISAVEDSENFVFQNMVGEDFVDDLSKF